MRLVELPGCRGGEADGAGPEIFLRIVALQPRADRVALAHVEHVALPVRARPQQQIHPSLRQLRPGLDLRQPAFVMQSQIPSIRCVKSA